MLAMQYRDDDGGIMRLRAKVLHVFLISFSIGGSATAAIVLVQALSDQVLQPSLLVGVLSASPLPVLTALRHRFTYHRIAVLFVAHIWLVSVYLQSFHGLSPFTALASVAFLLLSAMFLGLRAMGWVLALSVLSLVGSAMLVTSGHLIPWASELWDPMRPLVWLRYLVTLLFLGGGIAIALAYLVQGVENAAHRLAQARERERIERERVESVQKALEQSRRLEAMAQFAGGVAHDFNNSLIVILALAHRIESDNRVPSQVASLAASIRQGVEVSAETVRGLLSFSRADASAPRKVRVDRLIRRSETTVKSVFSERVRVVVSAPPEEWIFVDAARLQQALLNLALNARDAMPEGGTFRIDIGEEQRNEVPAGWNAHPGPFVVIACSDTGTGMDRETRDKAFEPFFTTKGPNRGTGLGLSSVRGVAYDANGFIEFESEPGQGTIIRLYFPRCSEGESAVYELWE